MGLDIYVRWGEKKYISYDTDGAKPLTGLEVEQLKTADPDAEIEVELAYPEWRYELQMTGFINAPESGYVRHNWASVRFLGEFSKQHNAPNPIAFYRDWSGSNGDILMIDTPESMTQLLAYRDEVLSKWLVDSKGSWDWRNMTEQQGKDVKYFIECVRNVIGLINFCQCHKDEPNLQVVFG